MMTCTCFVLYVCLGEFPSSSLINVKLSLTSAKSWDILIIFSRTEVLIRGRSVMDLLPAHARVVTAAVGDVAVTVTSCKKGNTVTWGQF